MWQPKKVVNYGSAGALRTGLSGLCRVTRFKQRDMDVRAPFHSGKTLKTISLSILMEMA